MLDLYLTEYVYAFPSHGEQTFLTELLVEYVVYTFDTRVNFYRACSPGSTRTRIDMTYIVLGVKLNQVVIVLYELC